MGGQISKLFNTNSEVHTNGHIQQRQHDNNNTNNKCLCTDRPCFFLGNMNLSRGLRNMTGMPSGDAIGTPLPDTPLFQRKRREVLQDAMRNGTGSNKNPIFSSTYLGLEKEMSTTAFLIPKNNINNNNNNDNNNNYNNNNVGQPTNNGNGINNNYTNNNNNQTSSIPQISEDIAQIYEGSDSENYLHEKYQLMEVLGVGSTSTVYRCVCRGTGKEFACKVIDCALIEERFHGMMAQFQVEIDTLRQLQHPGIIRLYDVYITDDKIFIVMELMEGGELFDYVVQKGTLTEEEASKIVKKVTSALVFMHSKNIVHRDLKPENLLLKNKPNPNSGDNTNDTSHLDVKIIDFGLSKAMEGPVARTFLGTRGYLAPEMLQRRDYTRAVDTWALGVIVFVLLCGCLPFDDDSSTVPSDDVVKAKFVLRFPRWAKNLSPSARDLLSHLLDVNPRTRYTAEQAIEHPWVRGVTARRDSLLASPGRIQKSPRLVAGSHNSRNNNNKVGRKYVPVDPSKMTPPHAPSVIVRQASL